MSLEELKAAEAVLMAELDCMLQRHQQEMAPIKDAIAKLYAVWPTRQVVWRDLETGYPTSVEQVRL